MTEKKPAADESVYRVVYKKDKENLARLYAHTVCKAYPRRGMFLLILGLVLLGVTVAAAAGAVSLRLGLGMLLLLFVLDLFIVVIGIMMLFYHRLMASMAWKNILKAHGGSLPETVYVIQDGIDVREGTIHNAYPFGDVTKITEEDGCFFIMFGRFSAVMLPKNAFAEGDPATFRAWIERRCPRLF